MAVQMHDEDIARARKSLPERVANPKKTNRGVTSVGRPQEERVAGGTLLLVECTENCAGHPNGTDTVLLGFARKGATTLTFDFG